MYVSNVRSCIPPIADIEFQIRADVLFPDAGAPASTTSGCAGAADSETSSDGGGDPTSDGPGRGPCSVSLIVCCWVAEAARQAQGHYDQYAAAVRPFFECPGWIRDLAGSLRWRRRFQYKFRKVAHINVLEGVAYGTLLRNLAATAPESRPVILGDSRVVLGATSKGRSSSAALNGTLRASLPYLLGGDLYPGGLHLNSEMNPADGPSRGRPVPEPSRDKPAWFDDAAAGRFRRFDAAVAEGDVPRALGPWLRLLLLLAGDA